MLAHWIGSNPTSLNHLLSVFTSHYVTVWLLMKRPLTLTVKMES